jgi:hypothetical protein
MKIKQTILSLGLLLGVATVALPSPAFADCVPDKSKNISCCAGVQVAIISCGTASNKTAQDSGVFKLLILILNIMTAGVGILAVGGIAYGAALYASAGDKPEQTKKGMEIIKNVIIGLVAYGLMFVVLNFLIPGGIFNLPASTGGAAGGGTAKIN